MTDPAGNIPVVIQQSGTASRIQEVAQRLGEEQQIAAREADAEETRRRGSQVQRTERSDAQNRVNVDQEGGERRGRGGSSGGEEPEPETQPLLSEGGGVVDVIV